MFERNKVTIPVFGITKVTIITVFGRMGSEFQYLERSGHNNILVFGGKKLRISMFGRNKVRI